MIPVDVVFLSVPLDPRTGHLQIQRKDGERDVKQSDTFLLLNCTIYYTLFQSTITVVSEVIYTSLVQLKFKIGI